MLIKIDRLMFLYFQVVHLAVYVYFAVSLIGTNIRYLDVFTR